MTALMQLEQELRKSRDYGGRKNDAAKVLAEYFVSTKGNPPDDAEVNKYFLTKKHSYAAFDLNNLQNYSFSELELSFYELVENALFLAHKSKKEEAKNLFSQAQKIAKVLRNPVTDNYFQFSNSLRGANLSKKLKLDACYDLAYEALSKHKQQAGELIGAGFFLAQQIKDDKRIIDFFARSQYLLYNLRKNHHSALSLGAYIIAKQPTYETRKLWTHFHNGNIHLDLGDIQFAKKEYESALDLALQTKSDYALMTLHERLALTCGKENHPNLANFHYENSNSISQATGIEPSMVLQNRVRCLIGQGKLEYFQGQSRSGTQMKICFQAAESLFKQAADLAKQIGYYDNEATAFANLGNLYRTWHGNKNVESKTFHEIAYKIQAKLGLDKSLERVKWNVDHMK